MAGNHTLGTIRGTIEIDYDGAGIVKAVRDTDKAKKGMGDLDGSVTRVLSTFGKMAKGAALVGASSLAMNSSLQLVAATLAVLGPLAAAGIATLPGIMAGAIAAGAVLKISMAGVGDALKAAGGDADKFNEALEKLSPNARAFAVAYRGLLKTLKPVQQAMQDTFFAGTAPMIARVAQNVLRLRFEGVGVARAFNGIIREMLAFAASSKAVNVVGRVLRGVHDFLVAIRPAIVPLIAAFGGLAGQAGQFGTVFGTKVAAVLQNFAEFISKVDLESVFANAAPIIEALGVFLKNVGIIAKELFSVFNVDGANAAGILGELAGKLAAFLQSASGQAALEALGQAMQAIAGSAGQIFLALLEALAPALVALAPGIAQLATQISGVLVPAINTLAPMLEAVAGFLSENIGWIGPLAAVILVGAAAYRTYTAAVRAWHIAESIAQTLRLKSLATWVAHTAAIVANKVAQLASAIVTGGAAVAAWIANTAALIANKVALLASVVVMGVVRGAVIAWTAVQWLLNAALLANPIGLVIIAIVLLVAGIILLWKKSETFRTIVLAVWAAFKTAVKAVADWFMNTLVPFLKRVWDMIFAGVKFLVNSAIASFRFWLAVFTTIINGVRNVASAVWNAIVAVFNSAVARVRAILETIRAVVNRVMQFFTDMRNGIASRLSSLISLVAGIPGRIIGALASLGGMLYRKGQSIISSLIDGIWSMFGRLRDAANAIVDQIGRFLPGSPAKEGPLSGRGYALYRGKRMINDFATGIVSAESAAKSAMERVMNSAVVGMPVNAPVGGDPGQVRTTVPITRTIPAPVAPRQGDVTISGLTIQGVWDFNDPTVPRQLVSKLHTALDQYRKDYR